MMHSFAKNLKSKSRAYKALFDKSDGNSDIVLADLAKFCHYRATSADVENTNATYLVEGRREVFLRLLEMLNVSEERIDHALRRQEELNYD